MKKSVTKNYNAISRHNILKVGAVVGVVCLQAQGKKLLIEKMDKNVENEFVRIQDKFPHKINNNINHTVE